MGFSVPAAMGAKVGRPDATVWSIDGDGCFQMTNQELATCAIEGIPIKVAIINNESLGMVRQWQTLFYNERYSNTDLQSKRIPDFVKLADAYGCVGLACDSPGRRGRHHRQGDGDRRRARWSSTSGCTATRWCGRWSPPAPATTTSSSPATWPPSSRTTTWKAASTHEQAHPVACWWRTSPACWPGSPACSAAAATTSTRSRWAPPSTPRSPG